MYSQREKRPENLSVRAIRLLGAAARSRSGSILRARHASVLLAHDRGTSVPDIARSLRTGVRSVESFLERNVAVEKQDTPQGIVKGGKARPVTPEAEAWAIEAACQAPGRLGYPAARWTIALIVKHVRGCCRDAGHPSLARLGRGAVCELLARHGACPAD